MSLNKAAFGFWIFHYLEEVFSHTLYYSEAKYNAQNLLS